MEFPCFADYTPIFGQSIEHSWPIRFRIQFDLGIDFIRNDSSEIEDR